MAGLWPREAQFSTSPKILYFLHFHGGGEKMDTYDIFIFSATPLSGLDER